MGLQFLLTIPGAMADEGSVASGNFASILGTFPLIWSTFIILICSGAVSSETGVIADSLLSKSVTRYQYILAKFSSRLLVVLSLYLVIAIPSGLLLASNTINDMTNSGAAWGILSVGTIVVLLTSLSVSFSTFFSRTLVAVMVVWVIWYVASALLTVFRLDYLSPISIVENLPNTLSGAYQTKDQIRVVGLFTLFAVFMMGGAVSHFARKDL